MIDNRDKKEILALKDYIDLCCIEAQKCIGLDDFDIWEKRRKGAEKRIRELLKVGVIK